MVYMGQVVKRWLAIALALMTALQSLVAIGGMNEPHHSSVPHHVHEHEHSHELTVAGSGALDTAQPPITSDPSPDHPSDHCHQNHAHFHMVLVSAVTDIAVVSASQRPPGYLASHTSATPPSLFRPPIV